jgi:hypothetical protein
VIVKNGAGKETMRLDGQSGNATLGGNGADGDVIVRNQTGRGTIHLDGQSGDVILGGNGADGDVIVRDQAGKETVRIDGQTGDIVLLNADCAEDFDASELNGIEAGTVVVLDRQGRLCQSTEAYDRRVAGVVSGAGGNKPGIILDKRPAQTNRLPLALVGKVYCKADALFGPIDVGDLLTTSPTPGHAMKADDPAKAFGAVLGKALRPLRSGQGLIPILVALQ